MASKTHAIPVRPIAALAVIKFDPRSVSTCDGALPWCMLGGADSQAAVLDANGCTLLVTHVVLARRIVERINAAPAPQAGGDNDNCGNR